MIEEPCFDFQRGNYVIVLSIALNPIQSPLPWVREFLSLEIANQGMKLTTHIHLVPRLTVCDSQQGQNFEAY
jgi:hypothetical protein